MAMKENVFVNVVSEYNGKALAKGQKQIKSFEKSVKSLARAFGIGFGAAALVNFGKKTVQAFMKDEAAAKSLEMQLKNTGYAFSAPDVEYYIANLQKMYGVLDDNLRPAFQTLLTASGSITKSQKALNTVLNVSAATGKSVEEVSAAVAKGFSGQTTALTRLGAGLSKATLATGDMNKILDELDAKFAGQATARLSTYAGKMDQLKVAAANASEIIGKDLLDSLSAFSKDDSLKGFDDLLSGIATKLAGLDKAVFGFVAGLAGIKKQSVNFTYSLGAGAGTELAKIQEKKKIKESIALRTQENNQLKAKTAVDKLKDQFDLERIGLTAALNAATDEETKLRIKAQLAILDNNEALAKKYLAEMTAAESTKKLTDALVQAGNAALYFKDWANYRSGERGDTTTMTNVPSASAGGGGGVSAPVASPSMTQSADYAAYRAGERGDTIVQLQLGGKVVDEVVLTSMLNNQKNGRLFDVAGGL